MKGFPCVTDTLPFILATHVQWIPNQIFEASSSCDMHLRNGLEHSLSWMMWSFVSNRKRIRCVYIEKGSLHASKKEWSFPSAGGTRRISSCASQRTTCSFLGRFRRHRFRPSSLRTMLSKRDGKKNRTRLCVFVQTTHLFGIVSYFPSYVQERTYLSIDAASKRRFRRTTTIRLVACTRPQEDTGQRHVMSFAWHSKKGNAPSMVSVSDASMPTLCADVPSFDDTQKKKSFRVRTPPSSDPKGNQKEARHPIETEPDSRSIGTSFGFELPFHVSFG